MRLALIGLPGSGKSTVGRRLARRLGLEFRDSDQVLEQRLGCSIRDYFERQGEAEFRAVEEQVVDQLTCLPLPMVLATGGGVIMSGANRSHLRERMTVIYLRSTPEDLIRRLRNDQTRPLLQVPDPLLRLQELFAARDPLYKEAAHLVVDTGQPSVSSLVGQIVRKLGVQMAPNVAASHPGDGGAGEAVQGMNQSKTGVSSA